MICNPQIGQRVRVHYAERWRRVCRLHGKTGVVVKRGIGRPRNHAVRIGSTVFVFPCGNLYKETT
jgi:hypothetical protein